MDETDNRWAWSLISIGIKASHSPSWLDQTLWVMLIGWHTLPHLVDLHFRSEAGALGFPFTNCAAHISAGHRNSHTRRLSRDSGFGASCVAGRRFSFLNTVLFCWSVIDLALSRQALILSANGEPPPRQVKPSKEAVSASPFHVGEQKMQTLTGARDVSEQLGKRPTTASQFFRHKDVQPTAVGSWQTALTRHCVEKKT